MDNRAVVGSFLACWSVQDVEMTVAHVHEDFVYALYVSDTALPYGGETRGKENVRAVLYAILAEFAHVLGGNDVMQCREQHRIFAGLMGMVHADERLA